MRRPRLRIVTRALRTIAADERGIAATEYALIGSLIAVGAAAAITNTGNQVESHYDQIVTAVHDAQPR